MDIQINSFTIPNYHRGGSVAYLRIYAESYFVTSDGKQIIGRGATDNDFYKEITCTVSGTTVTVPNFTIDSTTDAVQNSFARMSAFLFDSTRKRVSEVFENWEIPISFGSNVDYDQLTIHNNAIHNPYLDTSMVYTRDQVNNLINSIETPEAGESNTASNTGSGEGVYKEKSGVDLRFKSLTAGSNKVAITSDANEISIDVDTDNINLPKAQVGLGNANNTSDADKPVSTATQTALDLKANLTGAIFSGDISVPEEAYGAGWNGSAEVPTKNALYDKIETLGSGGGSSQSAVTIESFGAIGDGVYLRDGLIASGTPNFTSASGQFTADDVGKPIVVNGAGASGVPLVTTISAYVSPTAVTLAANASTTVGGAGKMAYYGTDDTQAFQDAIDEVNADGGGVILLDNKVYIITESLVFPANGLNLIPFTPITFRGANYVPGRHWNDQVGDQVPLAIKGHTIVQLIATSGDIAHVQGSQVRTLHVVFELINFRTPIQLNVSGLDFTYGGGLRLDGVTVDTANNNFSTYLEPHASSYGVIFPREYNDAHCVGRNFVVANYGIGVQTFEHADLDDVWIFRCLVGIKAFGGSHAQFWGHVQIAWCPRGIQYGGASLSVEECFIKRGYIDFEDSPGSPATWYDPVYHIDDSTNKLYADLRIHRVKANSGWVDDSSLLINGALHVSYNKISDKLAGSNFGTPDTDAAELGNDDVTGLEWYAPGDFSIVDGWAKVTTPTGGQKGNWLVVGSANQKDIEVSALIHTSPTSGRVTAGITLKLADASNFLAAYIEKNGSNNRLVLYKNSTALATAMSGEIVENTIYHIAATYMGGVVTVKVNGAVKIIHKLTQAEINTYSANIRAGLTAYCASGYEDGGSLWKNFRVREV